MRPRKGYENPGTINKSGAQLWKEMQEMHRKDAMEEAAEGFQAFEVGTRKGFEEVVVNVLRRGAESLSREELRNRDIVMAIV